MRRTAAIERRSQPAYTLAEAARYLRVPDATLRSWVIGRPFPKAGSRTGLSSPVIAPAQREPLRLSFWNLIDAHVLRSLRTEHGVALDDVRGAIRFAEKELGIDNLLRSKELRTEGGDLLLERYGELIELSASGQLAMRRLFDQHLARVEWDERQFPVKLYPFVSADVPTQNKPIAIDAEIAFGRPVLVSKGIGTQTIAARIDAGEKVPDLADDYGLSEAEIEQAVLYERAA